MKGRPQTALLTQVNDIGYVLYLKIPLCFQIIIVSVKIFRSALGSLITQSLLSLLLFWLKLFVFSCASYSTWDCSLEQNASCLWMELFWLYPLKKNYTPSKTTKKPKQTKEEGKSAPVLLPTSKCIEKKEFPVFHLFPKSHNLPFFSNGR